MPSVDDDPAGAWAAVRDANQGGLDDPAVAQQVEDCGPPGQLVRGGGRHDVHPRRAHPHVGLARALASTKSDAGEVARQASGMAAYAPGVDEAMRASGQFGPRIDVPADADEQSRLSRSWGAPLSTPRGLFKFT